MSANMGEKIWKGFTVVLGVVIMPLDAEQAVVMIEKKLSEADTNSKAIISIEKDIEYMKQTLGRIETLVTDR